MKQFIINHVNELTQLAERLDFNLTCYQRDNEADCGHNKRIYDLSAAICDLRLPTLKLVGDQDYWLITLQTALDREFESAYDLLEAHKRACQALKVLSKHVFYCTSDHRDLMYHGERIGRIPSLLEHALLGEGFHEVPLFVKTQSGFSTVLSESQLYALLDSLVSAWDIVVTRSLGLLYNHQAAVKLHESEDELLGAMVEILEGYGV